MAETETKVTVEDTDPQNVQDLTGFVPFDIHHDELFVNFMLGLFLSVF